MISTINYFVKVNFGGSFKNCQQNIYNKYKFK